MRMARKNNQRPDELRLLTDLLNSSDLESFHKAVEFSGIREELHLDHVWEREAYDFRDELLTELNPLVEARRRSSAKQYLEQLIEKINDARLRPHWSLWPADKTLGGEVGRNPAYERLGVGQGVLRLGTRKWIVTMDFDFLTSPKKFFYGAIVSALQSGKFNGFKRCQWKECRKFFVTPDLRRDRYCTPECGRAYDRTDAAERVRKKRKNDKRKAEKKQWRREAQVAEGNAVKRFSDFLDLAKKTSHSKEQPALARVLKRVGGWPVVSGWLKARGKLSLKEIWQGLKPSERNCFED